MTDPESAAVPNRLDLGLIGDRDSRPVPPHSTPYQAAADPHYADMSQMGAVPRAAAFETRPAVADDATRFGNTTSGANSTGRNHGLAVGSTSISNEQHHPSDNRYPSQLPNRHPLSLSRSNSQGNSQGTGSTNGADPVFTPPASGGRLSPVTGSVHDSSQDSQLLQLSKIAAAQERVPEDPDMATGASRKRTADGMVKHTRGPSDISPGRMPGHSRNTSTVSVASTAGSRIGELSADLKARLSYAMVKVNHGWQSHSIDQVESLALQAASPASSASTIHLNGSSTSPQLSAVSHRVSNNTSPATNPPHQQSSRPGDPQWRDSPQSTSRGSSASPVKTSHGLAPPVSIQPSQHAGNPRREPNPRPIPSFLSSSHQTSPRAQPGLHTSPYLPPTRHRSAMSEAMLVSPHTNVREQDAIESLLFMSSPGNSANLKHAFPSSASQPLPSSHAGPRRTALPTSQPRKSLPSARPATHARSQSQSQPQKRVEFEKSPSAMDIDEPSPYIGGIAGSPMSVSRGTPRRRMNGTFHNAESSTAHLLHPHQAQLHNTTGTTTTPRLKQLPVSAGLTVSSKPRPALADEEIDRMLDRAAAAAEEDSDSEGEIQLPVPRVRRDGAGVVGST